MHLVTFRLKYLSTVGCRVIDNIVSMAELATNYSDRNTPVIYFSELYMADAFYNSTAPLWHQSAV